MVHDLWFLKFLTSAVDLLAHFDKQAAQWVQFLDCDFQHCVKLLSNLYYITSILPFSLPGILGENDLAAQHIILEIGAITYMVCIFRVLHVCKDPYWSGIAQHQYE